MTQQYWRWKISRWKTLMNDTTNTYIFITMRYPPHIVFLSISLVYLYFSAHEGESGSERKL